MTTPISVLILEDRAEDVELLIHELKQAGYEVVAQSVDNQAEYARALYSDLDLILADYSLPQFDGISALKLMQARGLDLPFILVSGTIGEDLAVEAMKLGASDYVMKGHLSRIGVSVARALKEKRMREENRHVQERLVYLSYHDVMTGLYNRTFFQEELERLERGRQYPISIIVADLDGLKAVNDTQGHAAGDRLIRLAGQLFKSAFRADDIVARIGGDEFASILPKADEQTSKNMIMRINAALAESNRLHTESIISLSVGAFTADEKISLEETFRRADAEMYRKKETGRNRR